MTVDIPVDNDLVKNVNTSVKTYTDLLVDIIVETNCDDLDLSGLTEL